MEIGQWRNSNITFLHFYLFLQRALNYATSSARQEEIGPLSISSDEKTHTEGGEIREIMMEIRKWRNCSRKFSTFFIFFFNKRFII